MALGKAGKFADLNIFALQPYPCGLGRACINTSEQSEKTKINYLKIKGEKSNGY